MGIPYLTGASCFNNGNLDIIRWTKFPTNITHEGDLLITVKGTIGEMAFNNIGDAHIARQIMSISISPYINPFYVFYVLEARKNELIQKSSSLIPGITRDNVLLFQIAVPPRNEQDKIVETLKTSLDKIQIIKENIEEISNISALIKSQILSSVFTETSSYKSYYGSRTFTTLKKLIPSNKIGDGDWVLSENMDENGEYRIVQLKHIGKGCYINKPYKCINKNFFKNNSCSEIKPNFLLINRLVSEEMDACLLPSFSYKTITSVDVCWIAPDEKYDQKYLMYYLLSPAFQSQVLLKSSGSTRRRISKKNLISIPIQIHNLDDQKMIVKDIEQYFELLDSIIK